MKKYKILITQDGEVIDQIECDSFLLAHTSEGSSIECSGAGNAQPELLLHLLRAVLGEIGKARRDS